MNHGIALLCGNDIPRDWVFGPMAQMAGRGQSVLVVDGENQFRSYLVARYARAQGLDPRTALDRVRLSRAFTAYQLTELITNQLAPQADAACGGIVCLGLLGTLYDEDLTPAEAQRLLQAITAQLKTLALRLPILITVRPPPRAVQDRIRLARALVQQADFVYVLQPGAPVAPPTQLPLWSGSAARRPLPFPWAEPAPPRLEPGSRGP